MQNLWKFIIVDLSKNSHSLSVDFFHQQLKENKINLFSCFLTIPSSFVVAPASRFYSIEFSGPATATNSRVFFQHLRTVCVCLSASIYNEEKSFNVENFYGLKFIEKKKRKIKNNNNNNIHPIKKKAIATTIIASAADICWLCAARFFFTSQHSDRCVKSDSCVFVVFFYINQSKKNQNKQQNVPDNVNLLLLLI